MENNDQYLNTNQVILLHEEVIKLNDKKESIILNINSIIGENAERFQDYRALLEKVIKGTESGEIFSTSDITSKMHKQGVNKEDCKKLSILTFELSKIIEYLKNVDLAINLPSKQTLVSTVENRKRQLIETAINSEKAAPTDLSKFVSLVKYELDDLMLPYAKLWFFIEALPFSLDPTDPRYISLTKDQMTLVEDTKNFNYLPTSNQPLNGLDIIKEMMSWSDTVRAGIQLKRLLAFQQYLEGNIVGYEKTIEELKTHYIKSDCEFISINAHNTCCEKDPINRTHELSKFYKSLELQYGNIQGIEGDAALFINCYFDKNIDFMPKTKLQVMTEIEKTFCAIEDRGFADDTIKSVYGITSSIVDKMAKQKIK